MDAIDTGQNQPVSTGQSTESRPSVTGFSWKYGERFRQIRKMVGLNQQEFGELLGVSRQTINAYENDRQRPTMDMMEKVCRIQEISPQWLLTGAGDPKADFDYPAAYQAGYAVSEGRLSPEQHSLMNFVASDRERAVKLARYLWDEALNRA